jgi:hypothetical protein
LDPIGRARSRAGGSVGRCDPGHGDLSCARLDRVGSVVRRRNHSSASILVFFLGLWWCCFTKQWNAHDAWSRRMNCLICTSTSVAIMMLLHC